jgi:hypothetical protein
MADAFGFVPISKFEKTDDGTLIVEGPATDSNIDRDLQIADPAWLSKAMPKWFTDPDGANIREQHDGKRAVGTAIHYEERDGGQHWIKAEVVDPVAIKKVEKRVLRGFSFGARNARVEVDKAASGGRIVSGDIFEVSLVDRPANPGCLFTVAKADDGNALQPVETPELVEKEAKFTPTEFAELLKTLGKTPAPVEKRDAKAERIAAAKGVLDQVRPLVPGALLKADGDDPAFDPDTEASDVDAGTSAIAAIARLIISEAEGLAAGRMEELWDIRLLIDAASALQCFVGNETYQEAELMSETGKADEATTETGTEPAPTDANKDITTKTEAAPEGEPTETETAKTDDTDDAITKAMKPILDELALVKGRLAEVLETPQSGGPVRTRTTTQKAVSAKGDELRREIDLCNNAIPVTGGDVQKGYRERLNTAKAELDKLDGAA